MERGIKGAVLAIVLSVIFVMGNIQIVTYADTKDLAVVLFNDFENGDLEGWHPRGNTTIAIVDSPQQASSKSLKITERQDGWQGGQIDITDQVEIGKEYTYSLEVYHENLEPQTFKLTNQIKIPDQGQPGQFKDDYKQIASVEDIPQNTWTTLTGTFIVPDGCSNVIFYPEAPNNGTLDFFVDNFKIETFSTNIVKPEIDWTIPSLYEAYKEDFTVGVALPADVLENQYKSQWALKHFNSFTAENNMKPEMILDKEKSQKSGKLTLNFTYSDAYYKYAKENNIPLRGHTLVWHSQTPDWFFKEGFEDDGKIVSRKEMLKRMEDYIEQVVTRYVDKDKAAKLTKPTIYAWDVVNEAVDEHGINGMRDSLWLQTIGEDFIEKAFEYSRKYTKNKYKEGKVELFYNDYSTENTEKREAILMLAQPMIKKGIIDGIGLQGHINLTNPTVSNIEKTIQMVGDLGLKVHITELDVDIYASSDESIAALSEEQSIKQAYRYKDLFDMFVKNKDIVTNVTVWGLTDDASWLNGHPVVRKNWPLLFDAYLQPKLAYWAIVDSSKIPVLIQEVKSYPGNITVDGDEDLAWKIQSGTPISKINDVAKFKTVWKDNSLYVWVDVADKTLDIEDGVIIYVDPTNHKGDTANDQDVIVTILRNGTVKGLDVVTKVSSTNIGYTVEVQIPLEVTKAVGEKIGFDLAVVDGENVTRWNDLSQGLESIPAKYGTLILKEDIAMTQAIEGTPVIDGKEDSIWEKANEISTDIYTQNTKGAKAKVKTLWDKDYLYVLAKVEDSNLSDSNGNAWEQDSVEIFIDENLGRTSLYEADDVQYRVNYKNLVSINGGPADTKFKSATSIIDGGYMVEMSIPYNLKEFIAGQVMGFDAQVNDDQGSGSRDSISNWHDETGTGYMNTENYGIIILIGEK